MTLSVSHEATVGRRATTTSPSQQAEQAFLRSQGRPGGSLRQRATACGRALGSCLVLVGTHSMAQPEATAPEEPGSENPYAGEGSTSSEGSTATADPATTESSAATTGPATTESSAATTDPATTEAATTKAEPTQSESTADESVGGAAGGTPEEDGTITPQDVLESEPSPETAEPPREERPPSTSTSATEPYSSGYAEHEHESADKGPPGFYLRLSGGLGLGWASTESDVVQANAGGSGLMANIGMTIIPGLAIHGDIVQSSLLAYEASSQDDDLNVTANNIGLGLYTAGLGATYQWESIGLFIGTGAGVAFGQADDFTIVTRTDGQRVTGSTYSDLGPGVGLHVSLGQLFAISESWSLGYSAHYAFRYFSDANPDRTEFRRTHATWLAFAAAYAP